MRICFLGTLTTTGTLQLFVAVSLPVEEGSKVVDAVWCQRSRHHWFLRARRNSKLESTPELMKDTVT